MKYKIEKAFKDFDNGTRPFGYREPKHWYVFNADGRTYPAKGIWALAINARKTSCFNSIEARKALVKYGYTLLDTRKVPDGDNFYELVVKAKNDANKSRQKRLKAAKGIPTIEYSLVKRYRRNPDVVAEVLLRANGVCEKCHKDAPFIRKKDSKPFLEVHHKKQLANGGKDIVKNAIALCPNCHRKEHYG